MHKRRTSSALLRAAAPAAAPAAVEPRWCFYDTKLGLQNFAAAMFQFNSIRCQVERHGAPCAMTARTEASCNKIASHAAPDECELPFLQRAIPNSACMCPEQPSKTPLARYHLNRQRSRPAHKRLKGVADSRDRVGRFCAQTCWCRPCEPSTKRCVFCGRSSQGCRPAYTRAG